MTDHVELSPSSSERWIACPGSLLLERGRPNPSSSWSDEGTAAHTLAFECNTKGRDPQAMIGTAIPVDPEERPELFHVVDDDMADAVQEFVGVCLGLRALCGDDNIHFERRIDLAPIRPPAPMSGTADCWAYCERGGMIGPQTIPPCTLIVADYKHGRGVVKDVIGNSQVRYYGLGAFLDYVRKTGGFGAGVKHVLLGIIQPRADHPDGTTRWELITLEALKLWAKTTLLPAARAALLPNAALVSGAHCGFCKAKADCPALRRDALAVAQVEFAAVETKTLQLPRVQDLTPTQIGAILDAKGMLELFLAAIDARAFDLQEQGTEIPGWARKPKRATRRWTSEAKVRDWLELLDVPLETAMEPPSLLSPAKLEKLVKQPFPRGLVSSESSGMTLCRATDANAQLANVSEFTPMTGA